MWHFKHRGLYQTLKKNPNSTHTHTDPLFSLNFHSETWTDSEIGRADGWVREWRRRKKRGTDWETRGGAGVTSGRRVCNEMGTKCGGLRQRCKYGQIRLIYDRKIRPSIHLEDTFGKRQDDNWLGAEWLKSLIAELWQRIKSSIVEDD